MIEKSTFSHDAGEQAVGVKPASAPEALLLDCRQAAGMLHMSRAAFWKLHSQGRVPLPIRLSARIVRWRREELEQWVRAGCPHRAAWKMLADYA